MVTRKLDVLRNRVQEPRVEGRRKYSFLVPETLEELLNKPAKLVLDATPSAGEDEIYSESEGNDLGTNPNHENLTFTEENITTIPDENAINHNPALSDILKNANKNIAISKEEAIFIHENDVLDPDHLSYEQRLRLLKLAADPNNEERKKLLQMKLNNGSLSSLSEIVKKRLQRINAGEIELIEEKNQK